MVLHLFSDLSDNLEENLESPFLPSINETTDAFDIMALPIDMIAAESDIALRIDPNDTSEVVTAPINRTRVLLERNDGGNNKKADSERTPLVEYSDTGSSSNRSQFGDLENEQQLSDEQDDGVPCNENKRSGKKRKRKVNTWKRVIAKNKRLKGMEYKSAVSKKNCETENFRKTMLM